MERFHGMCMQGAEGQHQAFHSVRAGIIQPDGSKRYIIANGNDSHIFELTMSGSYRIYIQNETTEMVHVEGVYSTH